MNTVARFSCTTNGLDLLTSLLFSAVPVVQAAPGTSCPGAAEVAAELTLLLPQDAPPDGDGKMTIATAGGEIVVTQMGGRGEVLTERRLAATGSCAERAQAVAVVIAAWLSQLRPASRTLAEIHMPAPQSASPRPAVLMDLGAGLAAPIAADTPTASIDSFASPTGGLLAAHATVVVSWPGQAQLGGGHAKLRRFVAAAGPALRLSRGSWGGDARLGVGAELLGARGRGFTRERSVWGWSPALAAGVRVVRRMGRFGAWVGLDAAAHWRRALVINGDADRKELARLTVHAGGGLLFRILP